MSIYHTLFYFFIYGFLGWCVEVAFAGFREKRFVNRGFLNGPICPIYGVGIVAVVMMARPFDDNIVLLYIASVVIVTLIELVTGVAMDKLFHHKWWDYSGKPLSIGGYVCLPFSLVWGVACLFIIKIIHPLFERLVNWLPNTVTIVIIILFTALLLSDLIVTFVEVQKLNKQLDTMEKVAQELHQLSDKIGFNIFEKVNDAMELQEKISEANEEQKEKIQSLLANYKDSMNTDRIRKRIVKAFPTMQSRHHKDAFENLKKKLKRD